MDTFTTQDQVECNIAISKLYIFKDIRNLGDKKYYG